MSHRAPAVLWWAFLLSVLLSVSVFAAPRSKSNRVSDRFIQFGKPDQDKGARILHDFRGVGIAGNYYLQFQLKVRPRRGKEQTFDGRLWGSRNRLGPISRVALRNESETTKRILIQNGHSPQVWLSEEGKAESLSTSADSLFEPLVPETELTLFDLQMPYVYWDEFRYEGTSKILGRAAHTFFLVAPDDLRKEYPTLMGVRVHLDTQFNALVKSELIDNKGRAYKTMTVRDLKKVEGQWMVKAIDLRNELSRDKTRFQVTRAAMNLDLSPYVFDADSLNQDISPPARTVSLGR